MIRQGDCAPRAELVSLARVDLASLAESFLGDPRLEHMERAHAPNAAASRQTGPIDTAAAIPDDIAAKLPRPNAARLAVRLTPDGLRQVRGGHPWVYDSSIASLKGNGRPGDLAVIFDAERRFAAIGLYDPDSPIRIRVLSTGKPVAIDAAFWRRKIADAIDQRSSLVNDPNTNAYRVIHGDNDRLPGLIVDRYGDTAVLKLYSAAWFAHLVDIVPVLSEALWSPGAEPRLILRWSRAVAAGGTYGLAEGLALVGSAPSEAIEFRENGLSFEADVISGHKTGHFLDQRDNRAIVGTLSKGARVLDVFACTGGFSVHAAAGGASSVHLVDISAPALDTATRNLTRNAATADTLVRTTVGDAFEVLEELVAANQAYDLVIVDPPSFASSNAAIDRARHAYSRLVERATKLTASGGTLVMCSCSSRITTPEFFDIVRDSTHAAGVEMTELRRTTHPVDHPIGFAHGAYLKAMFARIDR